jgi:hypothetical protein
MKSKPIAIFIVSLTVIGRIIYSIISLLTNTWFPAISVIFDIIIILFGIIILIHTRTKEYKPKLSSVFFLTEIIFIFLNMAIVKSYGISRITLSQQAIFGTWNDVVIDAAVLIYIMLKIKDDK